MDPLAGLRQDERFAANAVARATGAAARAHDLGGRQGAVDVLLTYPDGRLAALEVTTVAGDGVRERDALLGRDDWNWPNPGAWSWTARVGPGESVKRLRGCYSRIVQLCEASGVHSPDLLPWSTIERDSELLWLCSADVSVRGDPDLPAVDGSRRRPFWVHPSGGGGAMDTLLGGLPDVVSDLLKTRLLSSHVEKLLRVDADEHHLFVGIAAGGIPDSQYMVLMFPVVHVPTVDPEVPAGVSHLWLFTGFGPSLIGWSAEGWKDHRVLD